MCPSNSSTNTSTTTACVDNISNIITLLNSDKAINVQKETMQY